jgi:hypothetical protein
MASVYKISENGYEAPCQEFEDAIQAELFLHLHRDTLAADGHEIIEDGSGYLVAKVNGAVYRYEVRDGIR